MKRKLYLGIALLVALAVTAASFAYTQSSGTVTASVSSSSAFIDVEGWTGGKPSWTPVSETAGSIIAGGLYTITVPSTYSGGLLGMLYVTNPADLVQAYSYLNLGVEVYKEGTSEDVDRYLTLRNGYVPFTLTVSAGEVYTIGIEAGSWYCFDTSDSDNLSPSFYLDMRQG